MSPETQLRTPIKNPTRKAGDNPGSFFTTALNNSTVLRVLTTATDESGKTSILGEVKQRMDSYDPEEKVQFLEEIFTTLRDPDPKSQDKRDAALVLLGSIDLNKFNPKELKKSYSSAISDLGRNLNRNSDPNGEIYMLLAAGEIILPFIENRSIIINKWEKIARHFGRSECEEILSNIREKIGRLIPRTASKFDIQVAMRINDGLSNQDIATELDATIQEIKNSVSSLRTKGMRFNRRTGGKRTPKQK